MTKIKNFTLKSGITEIGEYAFADNELATIDIQAQLDTVGNYSFYSNNLTAVTIDAKNIGRNAFSANKLTEVTLKNTVNVGEEAFVDNPDLKKVVVDTQNPPKDIFKENTFQENASPIEVTIRNNANGVVSLDKNKYLINIITVKISTIDKGNNGEISNAVESKHELSEFPLSLDPPTIDGYIVSDDNLTGGKLVVSAPDEGILEANVKVYYVRTSKPRIIIDDSKQLIFKKDKSLSLSEILDKVVFLDKDNVKIETFVDNNLNKNITVNPETISAPNSETEIPVEVVVTDPTNGTKEKSTITFKFTNIDLSNDYIIDGEDWQYKDFTYSGNIITGLSPSGQEKVKANKNLVLPDKHPQTGEVLKTIGSGAFNNIPLDTVNFEKMESLETIEIYAFKNTGVAVVSNIANAKNLKVIGYEAFSKTNLKSFDFESLKNLEEIRGNAFRESKLEEVSLVDLPKLKFIAQSSFYKNNITDLKLSNLPSLTRIENYAFQENKISGDLEFDNLPNLESIGYGSFEKNEINNVVFRNVEKLNLIRDRAFLDNKIESVNISALKGLVRLEGSSTFANNSIKSLDFEELENLEYINGFNNNLIEKVTFKNLPKLKKLGEQNYVFNNNKIKEIELSDLPELDLIGYGAFRENRDLKKVTIKNLPKLFEIKDNSFTRTGLEEVILQDLPLLEKLDGFNDTQLKRLEVVGLPKLKELKGFNSNKLENVRIENLPELVKFGYTALYNNKISNLVLSNLPKLEIIDQYAFASNKLTGEVNLSQFPKLKKIAESSFINNDIESLKLNDLDELVTIGSEAFYNSNLSSLEITNLDNLETIGSRAFGFQKDGNSLRNVNISNNPKLKFLSGFAYNNKLDNLVLDNLTALEEIGDEAFWNNGLTDVDLRTATKLKRIGVAAFSDGNSYSSLNRLTELKLPSSVEEIAERAYKNNEIQKLNLSNLTSLKKLKDEAFAGNGLASEFKLPETTQPIEIGREVAFVKNEQLDFTKTPGVKVKLLSAKPFKTSAPTVMRFDNDSQIEIPADIKNLDPNNPLTIYIKDIKDPSKFANLPAGIIVNPNKVTVKYEMEDGSPIVNLDETQEIFNPGATIKAPNLAGYKAINVKTEPSGFASFDLNTATATANNNVPDADGVLTFIYKKADTIEKDEYKISIKRIDFLDKKFRHPGRTLNLETTYDLKTIDIANEMNVRLVVQLPEFASTNPADIVFSKTISGVELKGTPYYDPETKQVIYTVAKFNDPTQKIILRTGFKFGYDTPLEYEGVAKAFYVLEDGTIKGKEGVSEPFVPTYEEPVLSKTSAYSEGDQYNVRVRDSKQKYADVSMTYNFEVARIERTLSSFVITDTIPTYKKYSDVAPGYTIERAQFDPNKNPGWVDNQDGTISYTLSPEEIMGLSRNPYGTLYYNGFDTRNLLPRLVLDFPMTIEQVGISNKIDYKMDVKNPAFKDKQSFLGTSTRDRSIRFQEPVYGIEFEKHPIGRYIQPYDSDSTKDHKWEIVVGPGTVKKDYDDRVEYYVPKLSNIEVWDHSLENFLSEGDKLLEYNNFTANKDVKISLYTDVVGYNNTNKADWNKSDPKVTYSLKAGEKLILNADEILNTKRIKFEFEGVTLSEQSDRIRIEVGTRLKSGKVTPNVSRTLYNYSTAFVHSRIDELDSDLDLSYVNYTSKSILKAKKVLSVTKYADIENDATITDSDKKINYTVGVNAGFTDSNLTGNYFIKDFELVDILPRELKIDDITLNPKFVESGGLLVTENSDNGVILKFKSPNVRNDIGWVAKIATHINPGAAGNATFTNRAYLNFNNDAPTEDEKIEVRNSLATPEENGQQRSTAKHTLKLFINDSLYIKKLIRKSSENGAWTDSIETAPEEEFEYKFEVSNNISSQIDKFRFFDIFPAQYDYNIVPNIVGVREARQSQFANTFMEVVSIRAYNYKTKTYMDLNKDDYPVKLIAKTDDFPRTETAGMTKDWVEKAINNPTYLTENPKEAKAIYIGGTEKSIIPPNSQIEVVIRMKAPVKSFDTVAEWRGKSAKNTVSFFYDGASRYGESEPVKNILDVKNKRIRFKKVDKDNQNPLQGALYKLVQGRNQYFATSGPDGYVYFNDIEYTNFQIYEQAAPNGYKVNLDAIDKTLTYEDYKKDLEKLKADPNYIETYETTGDEKLPVPDGRRYSIKVNKTNGLVKPVKNVKFKLEKIGTEDSFEAFTGTDGIVTFSNLGSGQYKLTEVANLNRFTLVEPVIFELPLDPSFTSNSINKLTVKQDPEDSKHTIYELNIVNEKYDIDLYKLGIEDLQGKLKAKDAKLKDGVRLPNVEFKLYQTNKVVQDGAVVENIGAEQELGVYTTNKAGKATINNLYPNKVYKLVEFNTPDIYQQSEPIEFYLDENGNAKTVTGDNYINPNLIVVLNNKKTKTSTIEITKVDADSSAKLEGATFQLFKLEGSNFVELPEVDQNNKKFTKTTGPDGKVVFDDVEYGFYEAREIVSPSGYIKGVEPIQFNVLPYNAKILKKVVKNKKIALNLVKVEKLAGPYETQALAEQQLELLLNEREDDADLIVANKTVYKKLKGAEFKLTQAYSAQKEEIVPEVKPNSDADYSIYKYGKGLSEFGSYILSETKSPEGFRKISDRVIKTDRLLSYNNSEITNYIENKKVTGQINITKFEGRTNKVLPGATFKIYQGKLTADELEN